MAIIKKNVVKREKGKLYYIDGDGNACSAPMKRKKKSSTKKKKPAAKKKTTKRKTTRKKK